MRTPRHIVFFGYIPATVVLAVSLPYYQQLRSSLVGYGWIGIGRVVGIVLVLYMLWFAWFFERHVKGKGAESFRKRGKDPEVGILLVATASCMTATVVGIVVYLLGGSRVEFYVFGSVAISGILFWAKRYRHVLDRPARYSFRQ